MSENRANAKRLVSFSKRRRGLFHKAAELCTKFDARIAVIVVSQAGNAYTFGHSSVEDILRRATTATKLSLGADDAVDSERERSRAWEIEELKEEAGDVAAWIDGEFEACVSVEQLELLRSKCLALRGKIAQKLQNDMSFMAATRYHKLPETQNDTSIWPEYWRQTVPRSGNDALIWPLKDTAFLPQNCHQIVPRDQNDWSLLLEYGQPEMQNDVSLLPVDWCPRVPEEENRMWNGGAGVMGIENGMSFASSSVGSTVDDDIFDSLGPSLSTLTTTSDERHVV